MLIKDFVMKLYFLVGFGVFDVDMWVGVFRKMSDVYFLFVFFEIVDEWMVVK